MGQEDRDGIGESGYFVEGQVYGGALNVLPFPSEKNKVCVSPRLLWDRMLGETSCVMQHI